MDNDVYEMYVLNNNTYRNRFHIKSKGKKDDVGETHLEGHECEKRQHGTSGPARALNAKQPNAGHRYRGEKGRQTPYGDINDGDKRTDNSKNQLCQIWATVGFTLVINAKREDKENQLAK
jgi:hypothetical protein